MNSQQNLTIIDQTTGEVIEPELSEGTAQFLQLLDELGVSDPRYLLQDRTLTQMIPVEHQSDVMDLYNVEPLSFADITNRSLMVYGAAIYEHEEGLKADGTAYPRYFQGRILVDINDRSKPFSEEPEFRIIKTSGTALLRHIAFMCRAHGWFIFDEPIEYKFIWRGAGKPHIMDRVGKTVKHIIPRSQRKAEQ